MRLRNRYRHRIGRRSLPLSLLVLTLLTFPAGCAPGKLQLEKIYFCDDFDGHRCAQPRPEERTYRFEVPPSKLESWFDLDYYMYFHSRETPGIRLEWNRPLGPAELDSLRKGLHCGYRFGKGEAYVEGELEGRRIDEDGRGLWCFDYLGTMMVHLHKKMGIVQQRPTMAFFPVEMTLTVSGPIPSIRAARSARIRLQWEAKEEKE